MHSRLPLSYNEKLRTKGQSNKQVENQPIHIGAVQFSCWRWPICNTQPTRQAQLPNLRKLLEELVPSLQNKNKKQRSSWSILYLKYVHNVSNLKLLVNHYQRLKKKSQGTLTSNEDSMLAMTRQRFKSMGIPYVKWSHIFNVFWFCILCMLEAGWLGRSEIHTWSPEV